MQVSPEGFLVNREPLVPQKKEMRKLIISMNLTLDGFFSGPQCELDWHFRFWNSELAEALCGQLLEVDTLIFGKTTYLAMAHYFPARALDPLCPREDIWLVEMMNRYTKLVFSRTLERPVWQNSRLIRGDIAEQIRRLKKEEGKNLLVYGSGQLVGELARLNLVDEYQLWIHPVLIGKGKPLFPVMEAEQQFELCFTKNFSSGVVLLCYRKQTHAEQILPGYFKQQQEFS